MTPFRRLAGRRKNLPFFVVLEQHFHVGTLENDEFFLSMQKKDNNCERATFVVGACQKVKISERVIGIMQIVNLFVLGSCGVRRCQEKSLRSAIISEGNVETRPWIYLPEFL